MPKRIDDPELKKSAWLKMRIKPAELAAAREIAARSGLSMSEFIRRLLKAAASGEITLRVKQE